jgi:hypothetical protein
MHNLRLHLFWRKLTSAQAKNIYLSLFIKYEDAVSLTYMALVYCFLWQKNITRFRVCCRGIECVSARNSWPANIPEMLYELQCCLNNIQEVLHWIYKSLHCWLRLGQVLVNATYFRRQLISSHLKWNNENVLGGICPALTLSYHFGSRPRVSKRVIWVR